MFAVCAIVKDEPTHYVEEWLDWHRKAGVDRFFIYDQGGWSLSGKDIVVRPFPGQEMQLPAYNHCLRNCDKADFLAFIDLDEFMVGPVKERLATVENALALNWKTYGTSGLRWNTTGKQMDVFRDHIPAARSITQHVKVVVMPDRTVSMIHIHFGEYIGGGLQESFDGKRFYGPFNRIYAYSGAWLNHYFTRSEEDWGRKVERGRADMRVGRRLEGMLVIDHCCIESDGPFLPRPELLPRVAEARYGVEGKYKDVTEKVVTMMDWGWMEIHPGQYNSHFGDPVPNQIKRLYVRFERNGNTVGELNVREDESLTLP